jgi:hypothetical protein
MGVCPDPQDPCIDFYVCHYIPESNRCRGMVTHSYFECYLGEPISGFDRP